MVGYEMQCVCSCMVGVPVYAFKPEEIAQFAHLTEDVLRTYSVRSLLKMKYLGTE